MMSHPDTRSNARPGPRTRRARVLFWATLAIGAAIGLGLGIGASSSEADLLSDTPLSASTAAIAIAAWVLAFVVSWLWFRTIDEHEARAYNFGGLLAVHFYFLAAPIWWLGRRGGFLPEPDHMLILLVSAGVWCLGWFWRRNP